MVLTKGLEKTNQDLADCLNTISIVSGLLITISFAGIMGPTDQIISRDNGDWVK